MIGQTLNNRYLITSRLGKGAMGTVYRATDSLTGQEVAVKVISGELAIDAELLERFKREGDALRKLKHPNIVGYLDAFHIDEQYVIVMEYVPGGSLHELLRSGPIPIDRIRQIALDVCDALIRAHRLNIIHRDIKPENILIDEDGTPKLADFGVARLSEGTRMTRSGTQVGTPYYMSPEAWKGEPLDAQADIWSLGVVLYEMLSGKVPFDGDTGPAVMTKVFTTQPPDLRKLRSEVPPAFARLTGKMLTRNKNLRYRSIREVAVDLERVSTKKRSRGINSKRVIVVLASIALLYLGWLGIGVMNQAGILAQPNLTMVNESNSPSPLTLAPDIGSAEISEKDGMVLAYVPSGSFVMGSAVNSDEEPIHTVYLDAFWIDRTEVTNKQYQMCVDDGDCQLPTSSRSATRENYFRNPVYENNPVIYVTWSQAETYCLWSGRRLPTEAEWEKAARGTSGNIYPWGNTPNFNLANYGTEDTGIVTGHSNGSSIFGVLNMSGNVWEWVYDWYDEDYYSNSPEANPRGPNLLNGDYRVLRGGSWSSSVSDLRAANRIGYGPTNAFFDIGFRCAKDALAPSAESSISTEVPWNGIISVRIPTLNEIREALPSIWDTNGLLVEDMVLPGVQSFSGSADSGQEYLWPVYWCARDKATLDSNLEKISTTFMVNEEIVPNDFLFDDERDSGNGWKCKYRATVIGNLPKNTLITLQVVRTFEIEIFDGQTTYPPGTYTYELLISVE